MQWHRHFDVSLVRLEPVPPYFGYQLEYGNRRNAVAFTWRIFALSRPTFRLRAMKRNHGQTERSEGTWLQDDFINISPIFLMPKRE